MNEAIINATITRIKEWGMELPAYDYMLMRFRGVGPKMLKELEKRGFVKPRISTPLSELGVRAINVLQSLGIETQENAKAAIERGELHPKRVRNYGHATHKEVCLWAGAPTPRKPRNKVIRCPHCGKAI